MPSTVTKTFTVESRPARNSSPIQLRVGRFLHNSWVVDVGTACTSFSFRVRTVHERWCKTQDLPHGIHVTFEILHRSGEYALFHRAQTVHPNRSLFDPLTIGREELEAASCIHDDHSFTLRCTLSSPKPADVGMIRRWYRRLTSSEPEEDVVVLSESRTIAIDNFSKVRAASQLREFCARPTRLRPGDDIWELRLYPNGYSAWDQVTLSLSRHSLFVRDNDESMPMLRFRFELHAGVYGRKQRFDESVELTHMFKCANPYMTPFMMPITSLMAKLGGDDRLNIRWWYAVLPPVPAITIVPTAPASEAEESVLTPLLSAMYVGDHFY